MERPNRDSRQDQRNSRMPMGGGGGGGGGDRAVSYKGTSMENHRPIIGKRCTVFLRTDTALE